jgi:hypothetical protein
MEKMFEKCGEQHTFKGIIGLFGIIKNRAEAINEAEFNEEVSK